MDPNGDAIAPRISVMRENMERALKQLQTKSAIALESSRPPPPSLVVPARVHNVDVCATQPENAPSSRLHLLQSISSNFICKLRQRHLLCSCLATWIEYKDNCSLERRSADYLISCTGSVDELSLKCCDLEVQLDQERSLNQQCRLNTIAILERSFCMHKTSSLKRQFFNCFRSAIESLSLLRTMELSLIGASRTRMTRLKHFVGWRNVAVIQRYGQQARTKAKKIPALRSSFDRANLRLKYCLRWYCQLRQAKLAGAESVLKATEAAHQQGEKWEIVKVAKRAISLFLRRTNKWNMCRRFQEWKSISQAKNGQSIRQAGFVSRSQHRCCSFFFGRWKIISGEVGRTQVPPMCVSTQTVSSSTCTSAQTDALHTEGQDRRNSSVSGIRRRYIKLAQVIWQRSIEDRKRSATLAALHAWRASCPASHPGSIRPFGTHATAVKENLPPTPNCSSGAPMQPHQTQVAIVCAGGAASGSQPQDPDQQLTAALKKENLDLHLKLRAAEDAMLLLLDRP